MADLPAALQMHQSGQLEAAAQLYQQILARESRNSDALNLYGVLHHQRGEHARAVELIRRAVNLQPRVPEYHVNLAEAYRAQEQFELAAARCRTALSLRPNFPEAYNNLGLALQGQDQHTEAVAEFRRALELRPAFAAAHSNLGISLRELRQLEKAVEHFDKAVQLAPDDATNRTNFALILIDLGWADQALPHCEKAIGLQPHVAALHHNLGHAYRALGRLHEAQAAYQMAIDLDPNLAKSHAHLGLVLEQQGQLGDALARLRQAVELEPDNATFWGYLGELYGERDEPTEAIPCWERVLALEPQRAAAHNALGSALQAEGRLAEAEEHYRAALQLQPDLGAVRLSLAGLHEERGEFAEAEAVLRELLGLQPANARALARLATLLRGKLPDSDLVTVEDRLADPHLDEGPRARLLFGLAHVLDSRGEYARAADVLAQANALSLDLARGSQQEYAPAEHERFVDGLLQTFGPDLFCRTAGAGRDSQRPVFVFGLPRSGTTLIEQVLASHSGVHGAGELRLVRQTFEAIPAVLGRSEGPLLCVPHLAGEAIGRLADRHLARLRALDSGRSLRIVDKMPDNYLYLGLLAVLFPKATFIHCRRDLRDVAFSCWMTDFGAIRWANDPAHIALRFRQYRKLMEYWRAVLPVPIHEVNYEETVADFETVVRRLLAACGLEWESGCLEFYHSRRPVRTASVTQVRRPVYGESVARWRNYERELADLFVPLSSA